MIHDDDNLDDEEIDDDPEQPIAPREGHPLFPVPEGKPYKTADITWISVSRQQHGRTETCPEQFLADDLPNQQALYERFGGGTYLLIARGAANTHMTRRATLVLPGPSKPLVFDKAPAAADAPAPAAAPPPMMGTDPMIALFGLMFQAQSESAKVQMQMMTTLMGTVVTAVAAPKADNGVAELLKMQAQQNSELMRALVAKQDNGNALEMFLKGQDAGIEIASLAAPEKEDDKMLETMMEAAATYVQVNASNKG